jgi:hypothetical protein
MVGEFAAQAKTFGAFRAFSAIFLPRGCGDLNRVRKRPGGLSFPTG